MINDPHSHKEEKEWALLCLLILRQNDCTHGTNCEGNIFILIFKKEHEKCNTLTVTIVQNFPPCMKVVPLLFQSTLKKVLMTT